MTASSVPSKGRARSGESLLKRVITTKNQRARFSRQEIVDFSMGRPDLMWTIIEMFSLEALIDRCQMRRSKNYYNSNSLTFCNTSQGEICRYKTSFFFQRTRGCGGRLQWNQHCSWVASKYFKLSECPMVQDLAQNRFSPLLALLLLGRVLASHFLAKKKGKV